VVEDDGGVNDSAFDDRDGSSSATPVDLSTLFDAMSDAYWLESDTYWLDGDFDIPIGEAFGREV